MPYELVPHIDPYQPTNQTCFPGTRLQQELNPVCCGGTRAALTFCPGMKGSCVDPSKILPPLPSAAAPVSSTVVGTTYCPHRTALCNSLSLPPLPLLLLLLPPPFPAAPSPPGSAALTLSYSRVCPRTSRRLTMSFTPASALTPAPTHATTALNSPEAASAWTSSTLCRTHVAPSFRDGDEEAPPSPPLLSPLAFLSASAALTSARQADQRPLRYVGASTANAPRMRTPDDPEDQRPRRVARSKKVEREWARGVSCEVKIDKWLWGCCELTDLTRRGEKRWGCWHDDRMQGNHRGDFLANVTSVHTNRCEIRSRRARFDCFLSTAHQPHRQFDLSEGSGVDGETLATFQSMSNSSILCQVSRRFYANRPYRPPRQRSAVRYPSGGTWNRAT